MSGNELNFQMKLSNNIIQLFQKKEYEKYIHLIMSRSEKIFPEKYEHIDKQANGECDFIGVSTGKKYDAKLPFTEEQVLMLVSDKKHEAKLTEWLTTLLNETSEYNIEEMQRGTYDITKTQLYIILKNQVEKSKTDENLIFFFQIPVALSIRGSIYLNLITDYLSALYSAIKENVGLSEEMELYAIYPSVERNVFAVRELRTSAIEFVECSELEKYFSFEVVE